MKSPERIAFENDLHAHFSSEIEERKQNVRYMEFQAKKQAIYAGLIETCISLAGQRFEVDRTFTPDAAADWIKDTCVALPLPIPPAGGSSFP
ncbi:hypothetical protein P43SY_009892 [Pythium insidiosum]|uniref:Uncharacterized protein n=1 Tax=Pythium insidiosum TaxID=114742 RepID=A0AAD5Q4Y2_PYTIN|nr:hypothetical protein P43SY_009892 [Pythium insidiosum]